MSYFVRACDLVHSRQPVALLGDRTYTLTPLDAPPFRYKGANFCVAFNFRNPPLIPFRAGHSETCCLACGRPGMMSTPVRAVCSAYCALAVELFYNDLLAVNFRPLPIHKIPYRWQLRLVPPNLITPWLQKTRIIHYYDAYPWMLHGNFADFYGLNYASSLLINPRSIRRGLKKLMAEIPPMITPDEAADGVGTSDTTDSAVPAVAPVPRVPAPSHPGGPIAVASVHNPVMRRTAEIVLAHLETANDFLSSTKKPTRPGKAVATPDVEWNKQQVQLFLGLLNRTIPAISASMNLDAPPLTKDPSEMTREELEQAALQARDVGKRYPPAAPDAQSTHNPNQEGEQT